MTDTDTHFDEWPAWPVYGLVDDLLPVLVRWADRGQRTAAIATLVDIVGSSPRPLGSEMAISESGQVAGYVSGGCVEAAVAAEAQAVLTTGEPKLLDYGAGSPVLDVQLTCGGRIGIFVRRIDDLAGFVALWQAARDARQAAIIDIDLTGGAYRATQAGAEATFASCFRQTYLPTYRLWAVGGDPVTLALCRTATQFGFEVGLIRPYGPSAPPPQTALFRYDTRPLSRALADLVLDPWSAIYTLTHDLDDDHAVIETGLRSGAFRIGALGSQTKTAQRLDQLRADGFDEAALARLDTPAGLDIGARNPREIALSVLAALTSARPVTPLPERISQAPAGSE